MNIIIIDPEGTLYQFETHKRWVGYFLRQAEFFSKDKEEVMNYLKTVNTKNLGEKVNKIKLQSPKRQEKIYELDMSPSEDYGITVIDFKNKKVCSINEYGDLSTILANEITMLFLPNYIVQNKKEQLENYKVLLEKKYLTGSADQEKQLLAGIEDFLNERKTEPPVHFLGLVEFDFSKENTGWTIHSTGDYADMPAYRRMVSLLFKNNILLSPEQEAAWRDYYSEKADYFDKEDKGFDLFNEYRANKEKKLLNKMVATPPIEIEKEKVLSKNPRMKI